MSDGGPCAPAGRDGLRPRGRGIGIFFVARAYFASRPGTPGTVRDAGNSGAGRTGGGVPRGPCGAAAGQSRRGDAGPEPRGSVDSYGDPGALGAYLARSA